MPKIEQWHYLFHDPKPADAILDRALSQLHVLHLEGEFMRIIGAKK